MSVLNGRNYTSANFKGYGYAAIFPEQFVDDLLAQIAISGGGGNPLYMYQTYGIGPTLFGTVADITDHSSALYAQIQALVALGIPLSAIAIATNTAGGNTIVSANGVLTPSGTTAELVGQLSANNGILTPSGTTAELTSGNSVAADNGVVTPTATSAELVGILVADNGVVTPTGSTADLTQAAALPADSGTVTPTGTSADLVGILAAANGTVTPTGTTAELTASSLSNGSTYSGFTFIKGGSQAVATQNPTAQYNIKSFDTGSLASQSDYAVLYKSAVNKPYTFSVDILGSDSMLASWQAATAQAVLMIVDPIVGNPPYTIVADTNQYTKITVYFWRTASNTYKLTIPIQVSFQHLKWLTSSNGVGALDVPQDINLTEAGCRLIVARDSSGVYTLSVKKLDGTAITSCVLSGGNAPYVNANGDVISLGDPLNITPAGGKLEYQYVNVSFKNISVI